MKNQKRIFIICSFLSFSSLARVSIEKNLENLPECRDQLSWKECKKIQDNVREFQNQINKRYGWFTVLNFTDIPYFEKIMNEKMPEALTSEQEKEIIQLFRSYNELFLYTSNTKFEKEIIDDFIIDYLKKRHQHDSIETFFIAEMYNIKDRFTTGKTRT